MIEVLIMLVMFTALTYGALVDIFDERAKVNNFVCSMIFCLILGFGYLLLCLK